MDLIIRRATLPSHSAGRDRPVDIGIVDGRIEAVEPDLGASGREEIDAAGALVCRA